MPDATTARRPPARLRALAAVAVLAWAAAGCARIEPMRTELDALELPHGLVLVSEETGPELCFAGDCPWVHRRYASGRPLDGVCAGMRAAVEEWGVTDATWRIGESELNPCTASARRGRYRVGVAVFGFDRLTSPGPADEAPPGARETAVSIELRRP